MNNLKESQSLYLQQHANNPVHWQPWSKKIFQKAEAENKLVIISIGYSSCHWCHVMEKESFEKEEVAAVMNEYFICVKVDREERPDIDQFYMQAVQLMTKQGGWPLNCITTPDGRPIYGGTYFPKDQWIQILEMLQHTFQNEPQKIYDYASRLESGMQEYDQLEENNQSGKIALEKALHGMVAQWRQNFDHEQGGLKQAPKFPMPNNYEFLLRYAFHTDDQELHTFVLNTLHKMANGGIFDHVGGGFTRYSTDMLWKVPHFEKMLYDNSQLLKLYSQAYKKVKDERLKLTAMKIWDWLEREMQHPDGGYFTAIDADSEGVEGRFYVWTRKEIKELLSHDELQNYALLFDWEKTAEWEDKWMIVQRKRDIVQFAKHQNISIGEAQKTEHQLLAKLFEAREEREKPIVDRKRITSWNALLLEGLCEAFSAFQEEELREGAEELGAWILESCHRKGGGLWHIVNDKGPDVEGFLEDYASVINAYLALYQLTFNDTWMKEVRALLQYVQIHFEDTQSVFYYFSDEQFSDIVGRKKEVTDNVIPASNSMLARAFINYGRIIGDPEYHERGSRMVEHVASRFQEYGPGFSNWGLASLDLTYSSYELAITGEKDLENNRAFLHQYYPNVLTYGGSEKYVPTLKGKTDQKETRFYLCQFGSCLQPTDSLSEVIREICVAKNQ